MSISTGRWFRYNRDGSIKERKYIKEGVITDFTAIEAEITQLETQMALLAVEIQNKNFALTFCQIGEKKEELAKVQERVNELKKL